MTTSDPTPSLPNASDAGSEPHPREIVNSRLLNAPRHLVFAAFSDPTQLTQWWGPAGFTNDILEFDLRPGGRWRLVMHAPDGTHYELEKEFVEITPPERITHRHLQEGHGFVLATTLADHEGKTLLTWRTTFDSADDFQRVKDFFTQANEQNLDRLTAHLAH
jgi:uncharacterized protein YndB with AHSA1/START domain